MHGLSKSRILAHRQCPRRLWLQVHRRDLFQYDAAAETRMQAGTDAGEVAQTLFPGGVLVEADDLRGALAETKRLLTEPPRPLFEATFQHDGVLIQADLLLPDGDDWRMAEVKSSTSVKPYHRTDAAVQGWVVRQNGLSLSRVEIAHIDSSFVYPGDGDYRGLFAHADISADVAVLESLRCQHGLLLPVRRLPGMIPAPHLAATAMILSGVPSWASVCLRMTISMPFRLRSCLMVVGSPSY